MEIECGKIQKKERREIPRLCAPKVEQRAQTDRDRSRWYTVQDEWENMIQKPGIRYNGRCH